MAERKIAEKDDAQYRVSFIAYGMDKWSITVILALMINITPISLDIS